MQATTAGAVAVHAVVTCMVGCGVLPSNRSVQPRLPDISIRVGFAVAHKSSNWACMLSSSVFPPVFILWCTFVAAEGYIERTQIINTKNI